MEGCFPDTLSYSILLYNTVGGPSEPPVPQLLTPLSAHLPMTTLGGTEAQEGGRPQGFLTGVAGQCRWTLLAAFSGPQDGPMQVSPPLSLRK